ncbi:MAG: C45 family autoproteolytic acyltransferase/hydrolase [Bacteroidia bacterium]
MKKLFRLIKRTFLVLGLALVVFLAWFLYSIYLPDPVIPDLSPTRLKRESGDSDFYRINNCWLKKSKSGLWEMYLEGKPFERGVINGKLTKELSEKQEEAFIGQIRKMIPSEGYLNFLKYFVAFFNRNLSNDITEEYKQEIYGVSLSASDKFDKLAPKYYRMLNYHAAHDIGHALQDKNMVVGCTSFGAWAKKTPTGKIIAGRNFDFYSGDEFAENKIVAFTKPDSGYKFMYITWAGFTGVVSGMNENGLTVTLNAAKSSIPTSAATPISLLAKEILQYSKNIKEAFAIAKKRNTFVSESILIASAADGKCYIIEKTPDKTNLYEENRDILVCPNHYQSTEFANELINTKNIIESSSYFRKARMEQLLSDNAIITPRTAAELLRDQKGINNINIGLGNEKAINQLIAHHSVIFDPTNKLVWVSTQPFQLGKFICYNLDDVFAKADKLKANTEINSDSLTIEEDPFLKGEGYRNFILFKQIKSYLQYCTKHNVKANESIITSFIKSNPESYYTYQTLGNYYSKMGLKAEALANYKHALSKEVATRTESEQIKLSLSELEKAN